MGQCARRRKISTGERRYGGRVVSAQRRRQDNEARPPRAVSEPMIPKLAKLARCILDMVFCPDDDVPQRLVWALSWTWQAGCVALVTSV
jgi:hypothetical protein